MNYVKKILLSITIILAFSGLKPSTVWDSSIGDIREVESYEIVTLEIPKPITYVDLKDFKSRIAQLESGGILKPYIAINKYGYMGKYQFGKKTLRGLVNRGYLIATRYELRNFIRLPYVQERAMNALVTHNKQVLLNYGMFKYINTEINGIKITMPGLLAAAHLVGPYAVQHYVKTGGSLAPVFLNGKTISKYDGNGTSLEVYLKHF